MDTPYPVTRRRFFGGMASAASLLALRPAGLWSQQGQAPRRQNTLDEYDAFAKLSFNENNYGPPESVLKAMTQAFKYANRYGYPDGDIVQEIAKHHGVEPSNVLLGAGSGEILDVACTALLMDDRKVVGSEPSYNVLYSTATALKADQIKLPLLKDYRQDIPGLIRATRKNYRDVGFVYLCNPNNPTGNIVTRQEVAALLNAIPEDVPVLIDEAYHHYVEDPAYATSVPYVLEGRQVIIARTFSKISGLAGMRLGYAIAPRELLQRMRPHMTGTINAIVKWGGAAALKDTAAQAWVRTETLALRKKTSVALEGMGYPVIPSETNFVMVHLKRPVQPVIEEFRKKGVLVGRPFPPMLEHLRVSIGTPAEMDRFMVAFREILPRAAS